MNINVTETNTITEQATTNLPTITTAEVEITRTTTSGKEFHESNIEIIYLGGSFALEYGLFFTLSVFSIY